MTWWSLLENTSHPTEEQVGAERFNVSSSPPSPIQCAQPFCCSDVLQLCDAGDEEMESLDDFSLDMQLDWQDLLALMEAQTSDIEELPSSDSALQTDVWRPNRNRSCAGEPTEEFCPGSAGSVDRKSCRNPNMNPGDTVFKQSTAGQTRENPFDFNRLLNDLFDDMGIFSSCRDAPASFNVNLQFPEESPSVGNKQTLGPSASPSSLLLCDPDKEIISDKDGLPVLQADLLKDVAVLDLMTLPHPPVEKVLNSLAEMPICEDGDSSQCSEGSAIEEKRGVFAPSSKKFGHQRPGHHHHPEELDSDSGLSLDLSHSPFSPCTSEASNSSTDSSSTFASPMGSLSPGGAGKGLFVGKNEGVGGEVSRGVPNIHAPDETHQLFHPAPWRKLIRHDHAYNKPTSSSLPVRGCLRDEQRARALKIPFSNRLIIYSHFEEFAELQSKYELSEEQLALIKDIRRRGKNKIAAQNCRKRKLGVVQRLEEEVTSLGERYLHLHAKRQEIQRRLHDTKRKLNTLYQDVFAKQRDEQGRPLDPDRYYLRYGLDGKVAVASFYRELGPPARGGKKSRRRGKRCPKWQ